MIDTLRSELLAMKDQDLDTRQRLVERGELHGDRYHPEMKAVHLANNRRIKEIINQFGWPSESEVGSDGAEACWLIVQHAVLEPDFQQNCVDLLKQAVEKGEAEGWCLAYLQDRVLTAKGQPQLYGTQHQVIGGEMQPLKTADPAEVNQRRRALGLATQQAHTASLQKEYDAAKANKAKQGE